MKPTKLSMDSRPGEQPENTYPYGKNGIQYDQLGSVINEPGFQKMAAVLPYAYCGIIETDGRPVIFSTDNTYSAIGFFDPSTGGYVPIVNDRPGFLVNWPATGEKLGFNLSKYITGQAQRNYKGELVIAFTDKTTFPKYLNCDAPDIARLDDVRLFPFYKSPVTTLQESFGGSLAAGTYYVATYYERNDGTTSAYSEVSQGLTIAPGAFLSTDKALQITVTQADTTYDFIRIVVIAKVGGKTTAVKLSDSIPISSGTVDYMYTGGNSSEDITIEEILTPPALYSKIATIGQLNDALYIGGLEIEPDLNDMQPYANLVELKWVSELIDATAPPEEHKKGRKKSLMHQEVYALYIRYHKTRGGFTKAFHLPGLPLITADTSTSTEATSGGSATAVPKYKVEDTIPAFDAGTFKGNFGKWQNDTEVYPNTADFDSTSLGGPDLRGLPVRHHRTPSLRWCKANLYAADAEYGKTKLDLLGIQAVSVPIPAKYAGVIDGYEILYAERTASNMTVYGQSALMHGVTSRAEIGLTTQNANIYDTGGNWESRIWGSTGYNTDYDLASVRRDSMRFHAFDMLLNKPSISPTFISAQIRLRRDGLKTAGYLEDGANDGSHNMPTVHLIDYTQGTASTIASGQQLRHIKDSWYLPNNTSVNKFNNQRHEICYAGLLEGSDWPLNWGEMRFRNEGQSMTEPDLISDFEETYLINLISLKSDIYSNFYAQNLVSAGQYRGLTTLTTFWGGDSFCCDYTFHTYGRHDVVDTGGEEFKGKKVIRRIVCESASNIHLRYEIPGNEYSKWYPRTSVVASNPDLCYITLFDRSKDPNQFGYTKDLNALNNFLSSRIFNPFREELTTFPYRIHRGGKLSRQSKPRSWRTFLPLDYYECQKNMGAIVNLQGMDDHLIIHHLNAMFRTQDKAQLEAGVLSVTLGTGDIFKFEPQEAQSAKLGYAGTQHDLACVLTPLGYVFVDAQLGEVYLYKGQLQNITEGISNFLRDNLKGTGTNPYTGDGITIGWDQKYKRILLTVKNGSKRFTLSYSVKGQGWAFFHDYLPDMYLHTREQLYSLSGNSVFKHHAGAPGLYYQAGTDPRKPFFVDVVFRADADLLLETINWTSELLSGSTDQTFTTLTHISVWNSRQHSGRVPTAKLLSDKTFTIRRTRGEWVFNDFRNILKASGPQFLLDIFQDYALDPAAADASQAWYRKELLTDQWFCVRFEFDNSSGNSLLLHDTALQATKTDR